MATITLEEQVDALHVRASGEIDYAVRPDLDDVVRAVADLNRVVHIDVDLGEVTFLDSVGVAFLLRLHKIAVRSGHDLAVTGVHPRVLKVLQITGTTALLGIDEPLVPAQPAPTHDQATSTIVR